MENTNQTSGAHNQQQFNAPWQAVGQKNQGGEMNSMRQLLDEELLIFQRVEETVEILEQLNCIQDSQIQTLQNQQFVG